MKSGIITQSNYIPWKGFFDSIAAVDVFVVFDEMQYTRRDWRNRNKIKTNNGLKWLSIPVDVKGKFYQKINETKISDSQWAKSHWENIKQNYRKAPFYKEMAEWIEPLYLNSNEQYLTEINLKFIKAINAFLGIDTEILYSKDFELVEDKTQRLVDICEKIGVVDYYTGAAAKSYMEVEKFENKGMSVNYWDYSGYPEYEQLNGEFEHGVSILDLLFNKGEESKLFMKSIK